MVKQSCKRPFHFCAHVCLLLAAATEQQCGTCEPNVTYFTKGEDFVRKRRPTKRKELRRAKQHQQQPRTISYGMEFTARTAKHKQLHVSSSNSAFAVHKSKTNPQKWTTDSGATVSVISDASLFETIDEVDPERYLRVANKQIVKALLIGSVRLNMRDEKGKSYTVLLKNVHYSPHFSGNLLSVHEMYNQHKIATVFRGSKAHFLTSDDVVIPIGCDSSKQYKLEAFSMVDADPEMWHKRFMHAGTAAMRRMGYHIPALHDSKFDFSKCDACLQGGGRKQPFGQKHWLSKQDRADRASRQRKCKRDEERSRREHEDDLIRKSLKSKVDVRFTYFGERIATDLCGPFPDGYNGEKYAIVFYDSRTKYIAVYCIKDKEKSTVLDAFKLFLTEHHHQLTHGVGCFWSDNGGEYTNADMEAFCHEMCVRRAYSVPYAPPQNPYAERAWGSVLRPLRTALVDSGADERFWPNGIKQAALVHNVLCDDEGNSPYKRVHGKHFDYGMLHVMYCLCYYLLPERDRTSKLSPRALPATYLGLDPERNGHQVYVHGLQRYTTAHHVVFNEHRYYKSSVDKSGVTFTDSPDVEFDPIGHSERHYYEERDDDTTADPEYPEDRCPNSECTFERGHDGLCSHQIPRTRFRPLRRRADRFYAENVTPKERDWRRIYPECQNDGCVFHAEHCGACEDEFAKPTGDTSERGTSERISHVSDQSTPQKLSDMVYDSDSVLDFNPMETMRVIIDDVTCEVLQVDLSDSGEIPCPKQYEDTQKSPLRDRWNESMLTEFKALIGNNTWEYVSRNDKRLRGRTPTKSRWVYTIKYNRDGTVERFKSRFVVCGYSQRQGLDYDRAFSATLRATTFRTMLAVAAGKKMRLKQFDVSNAFTQAYMDDVDMFVEPPKGHEVWEHVNGRKVSKLLYLRRALYGTKQASRLWQNALREFLLDPKQGFTNSTADPCLFRCVRGDQEILLGVYVDDILVAYRGDGLFKDFSAKFFLRFPGKESKLSWFLGMGIDQHDDFSIHVDHTLSIEKMAAKYIPNNTVTREHPDHNLFANLDRAQNDIERAKASQFNYSSLVGALLYIAVMSHPEIAYHTSILAKFLADPSPDCCKAAINLMQYLYSNRKRRLSFTGKVDVPDGLQKHQLDIKRNHGFVAYSDSSWGNKYPYPMFGYGVYLFGGLISFSSKQLKTVAFSSCEAEYAAASFTCKEVQFIRNICDDMGVTLKGQLVLAVDNTACLDIANDVGVSGRTKHFDRAIHYLRDLTQLRRILPVYVDTFRQRADGFTKGLDKSAFLKWSTCVIDSSNK